MTQICKRRCSQAMALLVAMVAPCTLALGIQKSTTGNRSTGESTVLKPGPQKMKVTYSVETADDNGSFSVGRLVARAHGKTYEVIGKNQKLCMEVIDQRDFEGNGLTDAVVRTSSTCGGNCCPDDYILVAALGNGRFEQSDLADSWGTPKVEKWKTQWSVVVISEDPMKRVTRRFMLENGKAVKVEEQMAKTLKALVELRSEKFKTENDEERHNVRFDLDGDGKKDVITGRLWPRWHSLLWSVDFSDGKKFESSLGSYRIGVLPSRTNGVHDLVCNQDAILRWNGQQYQEPKEPD